MLKLNRDVNRESIVQNTYVDESLARIARVGIPLFLKFCRWHSRRRTREDPSVIRFRNRSNKRVWRSIRLKIVVRRSPWRNLGAILGSWNEGRIRK